MFGYVYVPPSLRLAKIVFKNVHLQDGYEFGGENVSLVKLKAILYLTDELWRDFYHPILIIMPNKHARRHNGFSFDLKRPSY